jgi:long-chain acyl-CoA synthetase
MATEITSATRSRSGPAERQIQVFTSGTTGPPKQFALSHTLIARHIVVPSRIFAMPDDAVATAPPQLLFFPIGNISGLYSTLPTILKGQRAIMLDRFSLAAWREFIVRYRPAISGMPPSFYRVLLDADIPAADLASLKAMGAGAAPLDPDVQREFEAKYGIPILLSYGATEFGGPVTAMTLEDRARYGNEKLGSVGKPIPGARLRVVDPDSGAVLPANCEGLLEVVSPRLGPEWIRTTDIGMIDEDGFVFHRGRADGAIMRGGFKILPETIEAALKRHPLVSEAVVVGIPDGRLGEVPAAAVRLKPGALGIDEHALEMHLRELVMKTHLPVRWLFCDELPRTVSAKLDRNSVKKLFVDQQ